MQCSSRLSVLLKADAFKIWFVVSWREAALFLHNIVLVSKHFGHIELSHKKIPVYVPLS